MGLRESVCVGEHGDWRKKEEDKYNDILNEYKIFKRKPISW